MNDWLPEGKTAAVVWTIDDVFPGKASDADGYDGGGDLDDGTLGRVRWLLERHPELWVTLFTTPDWRETTPYATRNLVARIPWLRDRAYLTKLRPAGSMSLYRHQEFTDYLTGLPRTEIALHGLHHIHPGSSIMVEFQKQTIPECEAILGAGLEIFARSGLAVPSGMTPPGWNAPPALVEAMAGLGFDYLASARDIFTPVSAGATTNMSGLRGISLIRPELIADGRMVHVPSNFQATSPQERAFDILDASGVLSIKSHAVKDAYGYIALDGVDALYMNYLDVLFDAIEARYGDRIWWTSAGELARRALKTLPGSAR